MKANIITLSTVAFLFFMSNTNTNARSKNVLYHNTERNNNIVSTTYYRNEVKSETLTPYKKRVTIQNEQGEDISRTTYLWNSNIKEWLPFEKLDYIYDGKNIKDMKRYSWNNEQQEWISHDNILKE